MTAEKIYIFKRFERFWHWTQAALIIFMMLTGFEIHGVYKLFGFGKAVSLHTIAAWSLITLWVFAIFWHFTTGEWKQYIPTLEKVDAMLKYYLTGIFTDAPHPFRLTTLKKHNPLQRLAYLGVKLLINPLIWASGLLYLYYGSWGDLGLSGLSLPWIAMIHTGAAFLMLIFFIVHVYLTTTGHTPLAHIKAMITGWEEPD
ncbi:cytochrome b/b6 domain-containing protein [Sulfuricaulis sp.]|jgi:thiosulfate reductase cytochrome b subunit|uniref:cytochrome b/b6 domain-containing protein n=1 Tax=Sulfuricaulis sp. TaxID=2003553 RepID=UPI003559AC94